MNLTKREEKILAEYQRRQEERKLLNPLDDCFDLQKQVILSPKRRKLLRSSRRSGKSWASLRYLLHIALTHPGCTVAYATQTRRWAEELLWLPLVRWCEDHGINTHQNFNNQKLMAKLPNGSIIKLAGLNTREDADTLRGFAYHLVILDEIQSVPEKIISYLTQEILPAALGDYAGTLLVAGTPGPTCSGYFYEKDQEDSEFECWFWTVRDNPKFPQWVGEPNWQDLVDDWLKEERVTHGLVETDASYQREYLGLWAREDTRFIHTLSSHNVLTEAPDKYLLRYVLGLDTGWHDETAFVLLGYNPIDTKVYHIDDYSQPHMTYDEIRDRATKFAEEYNEYGGIETMVYDPAASSKTIAESLAQDLQERYGLPVEAAEKQQKRNFMLLANTDIRKGYMLIQKPGKLWTQIDKIYWNDKRTREDEACQCDLYDAWLYAWRHCYHWIEVDRPNVPQPGQDPRDFKEEQRKQELFRRNQEKEEEDYFEDDFGLTVLFREA